MKWLELTGRGAVIRLKFGPHPFRMNYEPLARGEGARGIFFFRSRYEPLLEFGHIFMRPGDTAIDLGANQGIFTNAFAAAVGPSGRVAFVEPIPWQFERVQANVKTNHFNNVTGVQAAISNRAGQAELSLGGGDTSASIAHSFGGASITVDTATLDGICEANDLTRVDFIKADVEGEEIHALEGASRVIERDHPVFCMEINNMDTYKRIMEIMRPHGYSPYRFDRGGRLFRVEGHVDWVENLFLLTDEKFNQLAARRAE